MNNTTTTITYTLFHRSTRCKPSKSSELIFFGGWNEPKKAWQGGDDNVSISEGESAEPKDTLEFVCHVKSPKEIAAAVRKDPLQEYVLFRGEMMAVKIAMPVFVDGKNLETFSAEWDVGSDKESGK